jgi:prophage antirepressor-like protein
MNGLQVYNYHEKEVRTVMIDNEPWFVAKDVCRILELDNISMSISRLDDDEKGVSSIDTPGGKQDMAIVNEAGLYTLILGSRKPEAKEFKRWITHEVIPTIRKTGSYSVKPLTPAEQLLEQAKVILSLEREVKTVKAEVTEMKEVLTEEPAENWQETMSNEVRRICYKYGLDYHDQYSELYAALESRAFVDLSSRVTRKKKRMKLAGAKVKQIEAVTKLQVIAEDPKLKAIFESVLQRWKLRQMNREAAL